ncbi:MAG TPA: hypothetical protein VL500_07875 [Candidatus Eisenbacteria bacterium]|nr:hypothetical protein [Candidatus Eisenbacteria bacterium]
MSQVVRWDARKGATFVHSLDLRLDRETSDRIGRAYGLISADTKGRKGEALAAHLEDAFTRGAAEAVRKLPGDAPADQLFEAAITRANHALGRLFGEYGLDVEPERVTAAIVAVKGHDVVAATWGKPSVLLYHPLPNGGAKAFDLVDDSKSEPPSPFKTANVRRCFGSIIAGRMGKRDRLLLCSQDLRPFVGDEKLEATVIANDPAAATAVINQLLSPLEADIAVAALVVDVAEIRYVETDPSLSPAAKQAAASGTSSSIAKLLKTQSETVETMTPSLMSDIGKKVSGLFHGHEAAPEPVKPVEAAPAQQNAQTPAATAAVAAPPEPPRSAVVADMLAKGAKATGHGLAVAGKASWSFTLAVANKEKRSAAIRDLRTNADNFMNGLVDRFNVLSSFSRVLLFLALSLVVVAKGGVVVATWNRAQEEKIAAYERSVTAVEQKIDSAEASMIYRDEARAKELLVEATAATEALPGKKPVELENKEKLHKKIASGYETLRREVKLGEPEIIASITSGAETPELERLATAAEGFIWGVSSKGEVFKVSADGAAEKVADAPGGAVPAVFLAQGNDVFAASADGVGAFVTSKGKASERNVDFEGQTASVADAGIYNARLYVLDAVHSRIMRHPADAKGFTKAQFYLKDGTDLSQGVSMAIDGAVYVLRKDGSIVRITKGVQEPFSVATADPPVTSPLRLRTEGENGDLFVLDASPSRILRFNKKTGALMGQYVSESLKNATDFTVDAKGKTAIVAVKNQLLKFSLPDAK